VDDHAGEDGAGFPDGVTQEDAEHHDGQQSVDGGVRNAEEKRRDEDGGPHAEAAESAQNQTAEERFLTQSGRERYQQE